MNYGKARSGMEIIPRTECLRLLARHKVGRLGFVIHDQPLVLPVNYAVSGDVVVFHTGEGSKLDNAVGSKVAFEVDDIDINSASGWSVVIQGVAEEITEIDDRFAESLRDVASSSWVPEATDHFVCIRPNSITGRRLVPPPSQQWMVLLPAWAPGDPGPRSDA